MKKSFLERIGRRNRNFWIGWCSFMFIDTISSYYAGLYSLTTTMIFGGISILIIGYDKYMLEKEKEQTNV